MKIKYRKIDGRQVTLEGFEGPMLQNDRVTFRFQNSAKKTRSRHIIIYTENTPWRYMESWLIPTRCRIFDASRRMAIPRCFYLACLNRFIVHVISTGETCSRLLDIWNAGWSPHPLRSGRSSRG